MKAAGFREEGKACSGVHHRQIRIGAGNDGQERLHAGAVDQQGVRMGKNDHIGMLQGIIMQAAGCVFSQVDHFDTFDAFRQAPRQEPYRIKARDNRFRPGQGREEQHYGENKGKDFFHGRNLIFNS